MLIQKGESFGFNEKKQPNWPCPYCYAGILKLDKNNFLRHTTQKSSILYSISSYPADLRYIFSGLLQCSTCKEIVSFSGTGEVLHDPLYEDGQHIRDFVDHFTPKSYFPELPIFKIPDKCPENVKTEIKRSFKDYWSDALSCAVSLRRSIEFLLTHYRIRKTQERDKSKPKPLGSRIKLFEKKHPEVANLLSAIRWIGNQGTHENTISKRDVYLAYEILELALNKLFDKSENEIKKKASEINKRRGAAKR